MALGTFAVDGGVVVFVMVAVRVILLGFVVDLGKGGGYCISAGEGDIPSAVAYERLTCGAACVCQLLYDCRHAYASAECKGGETRYGGDV